MPRPSERKLLLEALDQLELKVAEKRLNTLQDWFDSDEDTSDTDDSADDLDYLLITPPSPISPLSDTDTSSTDSDSESHDSIDSLEAQTEHHHHLIDAIRALRDEISRTRVLNRIIEKPMRASQLHVLNHFAEFRPHLFRTKLRVDPDVFDCILDWISLHPIFQSNSNHSQLPVAIQLAIFLNRVGHYGNGVSLHEVGLWAGVSVGSVVNCTNRIMVALLDLHDEFVYIPAVGSNDVELAHEFVAGKTCHAWEGGIFAADGTAIPLYEKPAIYGDTFVDRKGNFLLNCQLTVMVHNMFIVDYGLGHLGSVHDAYAFQGTHIAQHAEELVPENHWIWADSAYPTKPWCVVPFKALRNTPLSRPQKFYNKYLSKVRVRVEHAFAALKGRFQSLRDLRIHIGTMDDIKYTVHWVQCCLILHNMIIRFEETLGKSSTMGWAQGEVREPERGGENVVVNVPVGSPGQLIRANLMRSLFEELGAPYVVHDVEA